jgi:hypothetical protein
MNCSIWVIEKPQLDGVVSQIIGDFAIKAFASYEAFWFFRKIRRAHPCWAIVVNRMDFQEVEGWDFGTVAQEKPPPVFGIFKDRITVHGDLDLPAATPVLKLKAFLRDIVETPNKPRTPEITRYLLEPNHLVCKDLQRGESVLLTQKEVRLLGRFLESPHECITRKEIISLIWPDTLVTPRTLDCHISRLRKKIQRIGLEIEAIYGGGYCLGISPK